MGSVYKKSKNRQRENIYVIVSNNIKKYRKQRGYTQEQLAIRTSLSREFIGQIEAPNGKKFFSLGTVQVISIALDIPVYKFFM